MPDSTKKLEHSSESVVASGNSAAEGRGTYDERLDHILAAATEIIARLGYEKASMRSLSKASGVSLAGIYHYFDNKEKMLFLIQFRAFGSLLNGLREKLHGVEDPREQLRVMIRAHVAYFAANMNALKVCSHELDSLSGEAYEQTRRIRDEYYEVTRAIVDKLLLRSGANETADGHVATMALFGMLNWLYRWYEPRRGPKASAVANQIASQFLNGILGNGADADRWIRRRRRRSEFGRVRCADRRMGRRSI